MSFVDEFSCLDCLFMCDLKDLPRIAAAMDAQRDLTELREAIAWERECEDMENYLRAKDSRIWISSRSEWWTSRKAARAAVDALIEGK